MNIGPNWKNAPPWAKFAAMDSHGAWHWYEEEPALSEKLGMWTARGAHFSVAAVTLTDWQNTLHARGEKWPRDIVHGGRNAEYIAQLRKPTIQASQQCTDHGFTLDIMRGAGWSDEALLANGWAEPIS